MTVEISNYAIAISTLSEWLKIWLQVSTNKKPKPMAPRARDFSRALSKFQIIADWFIVLFAPVVIGWSDPVVIAWQWFSRIQSFENTNNYFF